MTKYCSICGQGLKVWERVQGRFDHPGCRERVIVKPLWDTDESQVPSSKHSALIKVAQIFLQSARTSR